MVGGEDVRFSLSCSREHETGSNYRSGGLKWNNCIRAARVLLLVIYIEEVSLSRSGVVNSLCF